MSSLLLVGDIMRLTGICTQGVQTALNTSFFRVINVTGGGLSDVQVAHEFDSTLGAAYKPMIHTSATYYGTQVQRAFPPPKTAYVLDRTSTGAGTVGGSAMPGELTGLITAKTAFAGNAFRGRIYPPFLGSDSMESDRLHVTSAYAGLAGSLGVEFYTQVTITVGGASVTLQPVIFHRKANKDGTTTKNGSTDVTSFAVELVPAVQRKRSARGRANPPPT